MMARMSWRVRRGRLKLNMVARLVYRGREFVACGMLELECGVLRC